MWKEGNARHDVTLIRERMSNPANEPPVVPVLS
jgi:hypothetical protein